MSFKLCTIALLLCGIGNQSKAADECRPFLLGITGGRPIEVSSIRALRAAGINSIRVFSGWSKIEPTGKEPTLSDYLKNVAEMDRTGEIAVLPVVNGGASPGIGGLPISPAYIGEFAVFSEWLAETVSPKSRLIQVWNQWNRRPGYPLGLPEESAAQYVDLLAGVYAKVKDSQPEIQVFGGSMVGIGYTEGWTERALDAGLLNHLDGLAFHPFVYWMEPERRIPERGLMELVGMLEDLLKRYEGARFVPLYATELGWPTHAGIDGVSLEEQGQYTALISDLR